MLNSTVIGYDIDVKILLMSVFFKMTILVRRNCPHQSGPGPTDG